MEEAFEILERTPNVLEQLLSGLSNSWIDNNEGKDSWSPYDIVGHLVYGEQIAWIDRAKALMNESPEPFAPFDREAQLKKTEREEISKLLKEFKELRYKNLETLKGMKISEDDLNKKGIHPAFGEVKLKQFLSAWVVHDLGHIRQITRVLAKQYKDEVGPWAEYLRILKE